MQVRLKLLDQLNKLLFQLAAACRGYTLDSNICGITKAEEYYIFLTIQAYTTVMTIDRLHANFLGSLRLWTNLAWIQSWHAVSSAFSITPELFLAVPGREWRKPTEP